MKREDRIVVIGAGVIGLSTAIRLMENGFSVDIIARDFPPDTTSNVAAAFWCPYRAKPQHLILGWAQTTYQKLRVLSATPETGVHLTRQREVFKTEAADPWYSEILEGFSRCKTDDLPNGFVDGIEFDTYRMETATYMQYLLQTCESMGARLKQRDLKSLEEIKEDYQLVINCSGVWARHLVDDEAVFPIRGQVVLAEKNETIPNTIVVFDNGELPAYIVPRSGDCLLGGTAVEGNWNLDPDPEIASGIRNRCMEIVPEVSSMNAIGHKVGLRPGRKSVRLERDETIDGLSVIHNYGHGGSGFTLSWGCADEVLNLVNS